jgi:hypothetical protein
MYHINENVESKGETLFNIKKVEIFGHLIDHFQPKKTKYISNAAITKQNTTYKTRYDDESVGKFLEIS